MKNSLNSGRRLTKDQAAIEDELGGCVFRSCQYFAFCRRYPEDA